jgi:hypothetical protein
MGSFVSPFHPACIGSKLLQYPYLEFDYTALGIITKPLRTVPWLGFAGGAISSHKGEQTNAQAGSKASSFVLLDPPLHY